MGLHSTISNAGAYIDVSEPALCGHGGRLVIAGFLSLPEFDAIKH